MQFNTGVFKYRYTAKKKKKKRTILIYFYENFKLINLILDIFNVINHN